MICRNCGRAKVNRPRGLCWTCYYTPGVKDRFPSTSKFARRGVENFYGEAPLAAQTTRAVPGTEDKLLVLIARAERRESLFHPDDGPG